MYRIVILAFFLHVLCDPAYCVQAQPTVNMLLEEDEYLKLVKKGSRIADEAIDLFNILRANSISAGEVGWKYNAQQKIANMISARKTVNKACEAIALMDQIINFSPPNSIITELCKEYIVYFENIIDLSEESYQVFENPVKYFLSDPEMSKISNYIVNINIHDENIQILNGKLQKTSTNSFPE